MEFDKGDYEFADKSDLQLDIQVSVINNQITHVSGAASSATIESFDSGIDIKWHGGKRNFLKE